MEKFIESFEQKSTSQKILITLGVTGVLLLFIALLYFLTGTSSSDSNKTKELGGKSSQDSASEKDPTPFIPNDKPTNTWYTYVGPNYQISYPSNLEGTSGVIDEGKGGTSFNIKGEDNSIGFDIAFSVTESDKSSSENINQRYRDLGYKEEQIIVGNRSASKFSGEALNIHENVVQFEDTRKIYKIRLSYIASVSNPNLEELFNKIISNIIIN